MIQSSMMLFQLKTYDNLLWLAGIHGVLIVEKIEIKIAAYICCVVRSNDLLKLYQKQQKKKQRRGCGAHVIL